MRWRIPVSPRSTRTHGSSRRAWLPLTLIAFTLWSCGESPIGLTGDEPAGTPGHVDAPQLAMTSSTHMRYLVDINNYSLGLRGRALGDLFSSPTAGAGNFDGSTGTTEVLYAGGAAYGSSPESVFFYNTRGTGRSFRPWASSLRPGAAIEVFSPGEFADNQTVTVMLELVEGQGEPRLPLGLVTVRETSS